MRRAKIQDLIRIAETAIQNEYKLGTNDCNLLVLEWIDTLCGTDYVSVGHAQYSTIQEGLQLFKSIGFSGLEELVQNHGTETEFPIIGDVLIEHMNASVVLQGTYISLDHDTMTFKIERLENTKENTKYYRIN
jgi:hypothetical protein